MTDTPDTNCPRCGEHLNYGCNCTSLEIEASYREDAATALDAANARIAELEDKLGLERALSDGAHRRARNARAEALEEAAKVADRIMRDYAELSYSPHHDRMQNAAKTYCAGEIAAAIRAMKGDHAND